MSVSVVKDKGMTMITVASYAKSVLPPLCQLPKALCYSPVRCSIQWGLVQTSIISALAAVQLMVGLFNISVGPGRESLHPGDFADIGVAYWLGGVFIATGVISVLAVWSPAYCSVCFSVFLNIVGSIFAILGIVIYSVNMVKVTFVNKCDSPNYIDNCLYVAYCAERMLAVMDMTMIFLAILQLCVCISLSVLGIKALVNRKKVQVDTDVETYQPVPVKVLTTSPGA